MSSGRAMVIQMWPWTFSHLITSCLPALFTFQGDSLGFVPIATPPNGPPRAALLHVSSSQGQPWLINHCTTRSKGTGIFITDTALAYQPLQEFQIASKSSIRTDGVLIPGTALAYQPLNSQHQLFCVTVQLTDTIIQKEKSFCRHCKIAKFNPANSLFVEHFSQHFEENRLSTQLLSTFPFLKRILLQISG